jgi:hypothetical protein
MKNIVIGLVGYEGAGKSTVAAMLAKRLGGEVLPLATPIKRALAAIGVPEANLYGTQAEKETPLPLLGGKSARHAMQTLGTEWGRKLNPDLWVNVWKEETKPKSIVICDDVRFLSEAKVINQMGGYMVRVCNPNVSKNIRHVSNTEHRLIGCVHEVDNSRGRYALSLEVDKLVDVLNDKRKVSYLENLHKDKEVHVR